MTDAEVLEMLAEISALTDLSAFDRRKLSVMLPSVLISKMIDRFEEIDTLCEAYQQKMKSAGAGRRAQENCVKERGGE